MNLYMAEADIVRMYKEAADKSKQIGILADLNLTSRQDIKAVLLRNGVEPTSRTRVSTRRRLDIKTAQTLYNMGLSDRDIARRMGVSRHTIDSWRLRAGLPSQTPARGSGKSRIDREKACAMVARGCTTRQIADALGEKYKVVYQWRQRNGLLGPKKEVGV